MPFSTYCLLKNNKVKLSFDGFKKKFGDLYSEFNIRDWNAVMFNVYFLIRRLLLAITIIFADFFPIGQLVVLSGGSYILVIYILRVKPYKHHLMNKMEIFNETVILFLSYMLWAFTDYQHYP